MRQKMYSVDRMFENLPNGKRVMYDYYYFTDDCNAYYLDKTKPEFFLQERDSFIFIEVSSATDDLEEFLYQLYSEGYIVIARCTTHDNAQAFCSTGRWKEVTACLVTKGNEYYVTTDFTLYSSMQRTNPRSDNLERNRLDISTDAKQLLERFNISYKYYNDANYRSDQILNTSPEYFLNVRNDFILVSPNVFRTELLDVLYSLSNQGWLVILACYSDDFADMFLTTGQWSEVTGQVPNMNDGCIYLTTDPALYYDLQDFNQKAGY